MILRNQNGSGFLRYFRNRRTSPNKNEDENENRIVKTFQETCPIFPLQSCKTSKILKEYNSILLRRDRNFFKNMKSSKVIVIKTLFEEVIKIIYNIYKYKYKPKYKSKSNYNYNFLHILNNESKHESKNQSENKSIHESKNQSKHESQKLINVGLLNNYDENLLNKIEDRINAGPFSGISDYNYTPELLRLMKNIIYIYIINYKLIKKLNNIRNLDSEKMTNIEDFGKILKSIIELIKINLSCWKYWDNES